MAGDRTPGAGKIGTRQISTGKISAADISPNRRRGGDLRVLLGPATVGATSGFMGLLALEPGEYVSEHYHPYSEEFLCVTRGTMTVRVEGEPAALAEGEGIMVPIGQRHRVENNGQVRSEAVFHLCPLAPHPSLGHVDTEPLVAPDQPAGSVG
ncbi:MAG TPA: cupin domain-containing protein [Streptosporangiaceae bacterium]|jgi:putative monooxygenase